MSVPGAGCGMVSETGIVLVIETTWEFRNVAWLVCFPGSCIVYAAIELPNRPSEEHIFVKKKSNAKIERSYALFIKKGCDQSRTIQIM